MPFDGMKYNNGNSAPVSTMYPQLNDFYWQRKSLIELQKETFFGQLADTTTMPKHFGKTIKLYHYLPLLDDRNINDQGINAAGSSTGTVYYITAVVAAGKKNAGRLVKKFTSTVSAADAQNKAIKWATEARITSSTTWANVQSDLAADITFTESTLSKVNPGNLYGSSRDIGTIPSKLPTLSEDGGRVNRVGFSRVTLEGTINNFGFFDEYTQESLDFDTDAELMSHITRETTRAMNQMNEDMIQMDLINGAGVVYYGGTATKRADISPETGTDSKLSLDILYKVDAILNENMCPKDTKIITGSRMIDTKVVGAARYAFIGSELKPELMKLGNGFGGPAFIPVQQYAAAGTIANGEIGAIGNFRFIENPNMMHWEGAGASVTTNPGYRATGGKYDVFPILIVGSGSFTTIGFQTSGQGSKFKILHKAPGEAMATYNDPYGKTGFYSIQWWYGSMVLRPEWIACIQVAAPY